MSKTCLHHTKSPHSATWWVIGSHCIAVNNGVLAFVWPLSMCDAINEHSRRCGCVCASIKDKTRLNFLNHSCGVCMVPHPHGGRVPMHVTEEAFMAPILHLDRLLGHKREKCSVHLKADVFSCTKCSTDTTKLELHSVWGYSQTGSNLFLIFMKPLSGDMHDNTSTVFIRTCKC